MKLRWKLPLLLGGLMAAQAATQWLMVRQLTATTLREQARQTLEASRRLVEVFNRREMPETAPEPPSEGGRPRRLVKVLDYREEQREPGGGRTEARSGDLPPGGGENFEVSLDVVGPESASSPLSRPPETFRLRLAGPGLNEDIEISSEALRAGFDGLTRRLLLGTLGILALGLVLGAGAAHKMLLPLTELAAAAEEISKGRLGRQVSSRGGGEVQTAIDAFNAMSRRLRRHRRERRAWQESRHLSELGEVARSLAHTIRNPLNTLGLGLEELAALGDRHDPAAQALARSARRQIRRIDQWIRSFLALASGGGQLSGPVDAAGLVRDIVLEFVQESEARIEIREADFESLPPLTGVEAELRGMIQALVANAVEAVSGDQGVRIGARRREGRILLEVADDGPGLSEEVRRRLFRPHVTTKPRGAGMGLYLTHRLARLRYGGGLELSPGPGGGTVAVLTLGERRLRTPKGASDRAAEAAR